MAANLGAIVQKTRQLDERIAEIAQSSHEQNEGISQINNAVANMDKITQSNAAVAEQSAAASDELKAQAGQVRVGVAELLRMALGSAAHSTVAARPVAPEPTLPTGAFFASRPNGSNGYHNGRGHHSPVELALHARNGH